MTAEEAAWVGALIEGEGCVTFGRSNWSLVVASTEIETVATLLRLTGAGTVCLASRPPNRRPVWRWCVARKIDLRAVMWQVYPYLTGDLKRERANYVCQAPTGLRHA